MAKDQRERLAELYEAQPRERLAEAGRRHLDGDLRLRARRLRRWMWVIGLAVAALAVFAAILVCTYLLERTRETADRFERHRDQELRREGGEADP